MSVPRIAAVAVAVEQALAGLEAGSGWQPNAHLEGTLVRRRHSLRLLRHALADTDRAALRVLARSAGSRAVAPEDLGTLLLAEERLAGLLDGWIAVLPRGHAHCGLALHLRTETDDAARVLRMILACGE